MFFCAEDKERFKNVFEREISRTEGIISSQRNKSNDFQSAHQSLAYDETRHQEALTVLLQKHKRAADSHRL